MKLHARWLDPKSGTTLLETLVGASIFTVISAGLFVALKGGLDSFKTGESMSASTEEGAQFMEGLRRDLEETGIEFVDTAQRYSYNYGSTTAYYDFRNHYWESNSGLYQCSSASCPWNTNADANGQVTDAIPLAYMGRNYNTNSYYQQTATTSVAKSGRAWRQLGQATCPLDNNYATSGTELDSMTLFSPRDANGSFITSEYSTAQNTDGDAAHPDWQAMVFYFPYYDSSADDLQLRRLVVYKHDLIDGSSYDTDPSTAGVQSIPKTTWYSEYAYSNNWTDWATNNPANRPTMIDLWDFGTDGTINAVPDGAIPIEPYDSDASSDSNQVYSYASSIYDPSSGTYTTTYSQCLYRYKYLYASDGTYRYNYIYIHRDTGDVYWYAYFAKNSWANYWYRYAYFRREPEIVAHNLVDVDFSTSVSNPYSADTNPNGVVNGKVVRVTIVLSDAQTIEGQRREVDQVIDFQIQPRN